MPSGDAEEDPEERKPDAPGEMLLAWPTRRAGVLGVSRHGLGSQLNRVSWLRCQIWYHGHLAKEQVGAVEG